MTVPSTLPRTTIVDFIADIFLRRGAESCLGEDVTMAEHMLQGALLAEQAGASAAMSQPSGICAPPIRHISPGCPAHPCILYHCKAVQ